MAKISVVRGDDVTLNLTFKDEDGDAINITGYTIFFTVKERLGDIDADALISKSTTTHSNPTGGISSLELTASETNLDEGLYYFDFQLKTSAGKINSTTRDVFEVSRDVTIRTT